MTVYKDNATGMWRVSLHELEGGAKAEAKTWVCN